MKNVGKYGRECCGHRLLARYQFCPICGTEAKRPASTEANLILAEIDQRARGSETNAQKLRAKLAGIQGETVEEDGYKVPAWRARRSLEKSIAGFTKSALWYRSVERLICDLAARKTS